MWPGGRLPLNTRDGREAMTTGAALSKQSILIPYYILVFMMSVALSLTDEGYIIFGCNVGIIVTEMYAVMTYCLGEQHGHRFTGQQGSGAAQFLLCLELVGHIQDVGQLAGGQLAHFQQIFHACFWMKRSAA